MSTARQGQSGLGLEAQRSAVASYLNGGDWTLVAEFVEVESGRKESRPELKRAIDACRIHGATLVVAKLDRLSRSAVFLMNLQESGVRFVAADNPHMTEMVVGILAVVAQEEAKMISTRTKAALAAAKAMGRKLGSPKPMTEEIRSLGRTASAQSRTKRSKEWRSLILPTVQKAFEESGSYAGASRILNALNIPARRGGEWSPAQVFSLISTRR
ncbi:recombinase family protein [Gemmatimonas phototrophica]|uniref:recombinase family protein n=1 Tax=Gemmatimonas phototrophica TaxID=1379270 RepID=UPI001930E70F